MAFIAGGYNVTYAATSLGQIEDGIKFSWQNSADIIRGDNLGDSDQDGVFRGGSLFAEFTLTEWSHATANILAAMWPFSATFGQVAGRIGYLLSAFDASLVFTAVSGTSAVPTTITAAQALLAPGFSVETLLAPRLRRVPLRFQLFPNGSSLTATCFTFSG